MPHPLTHEILPSAHKFTPPSPRRGWPVVGRGMPDIGDLYQYLQWRGRLGLPEESYDFSDRDVFDVATHLIDNPPPPPAEEKPPLLFAPAPLEESA